MQTDEAMTREERFRLETTARWTVLEADRIAQYDQNCMPLSCMVG